MKLIYQRRLNQIGLMCRKIIYYWQCKGVFKTYNNYSLVYNGFNMYLEKVNEEKWLVTLRPERKAFYDKTPALPGLELFLIFDKVIESGDWVLGKGRTNVMDLKRIKEKLEEEK